MKSLFKKKTPVPKSFSKAFFEKYKPLFVKARKELGKDMGNYGAALKIKKDDPKAWNRIMEDVAKDIAANKKKEK